VKDTKEPLSVMKLSYFPKIAGDTTFLTSGKPKRLDKIKANHEPMLYPIVE
jgi:hypothetical protein